MVENVRNGSLHLMLRTWVAGFPKDTKAPTSFSQHLPGLPKISNLVKEGKLKADSPSFQLKESFDKIPMNLRNDEFNARQTSQTFYNPTSG